MPACEYARLKEDEVQELIRSIRYKEYKLKLVTKSEEYNSQVYKKTSIIKIMDLNYG